MVCCPYTTLCDLATNFVIIRNWGLHVTSSCHRVKVYSVNRSKPDTAARLKVMEEKGIPLNPITRPLEIDLETEEQYEEVMKARDGRDPRE